MVSSLYLSDNLLPAILTVSARGCTIHDMVRLHCITLQDIYNCHESIVVMMVAMTEVSARGCTIHDMVRLHCITLQDIYNCHESIVVM